MTRAKGGIFFLLILIGTDDWWERERQSEWIKSVRIRFDTHKSTNGKKDVNFVWNDRIESERSFVGLLVAIHTCIISLLMRPGSIYSSCVHPMNWLWFSVHLLARWAPSLSFTRRLEKWPTCYSQRVYAGKMYIYRCDMFRSRSVVN